jgi:hypothetical protein
MTVWSFYDSDGFFTGVQFGGPEEMLSLNTPVGQNAWPGSVDHRAQMVVDGALTSIPQVAQSVDDTRAAAISRLSARCALLERGVDRALRQFVLSSPGHPATARVQQIEDDIAPIRAAIEAVKNAATADQIFSAVAEVFP